MLNISAHAIWIWDHLKQPNIYIRESLNLQKKRYHERRKVDNSSLVQCTVDNHRKKMTKFTVNIAIKLQIFFSVLVLVIVCFLHSYTHVIHDSDKSPKVHILRECSSALRAILLITDRNKSSQRVAVNINWFEKYQLKIHRFAAIYKYRKRLYHAHNLNRFNGILLDAGDINSSLIHFTNIYILV